MFMSKLVMCVILAVLQPSVLASEMSEELHLLQQQFLRMQQQAETMQQQMATEQLEKQEMQQSREMTDEWMKQQLKAIQQQMTTEREEMQHKMATERQQMQQRQQRMQQKMSNIEKENTKLKHDMNNVNDKLANVAQLNEMVNVLQQDNTDLGITFQNVSDKVTKALGSKHNSTFRGFSAFASASRNYNNDVTLLFDSVKTNVPLDPPLYNPSTSTFTCAPQGYYLFSMTVFAQSGYDIDADMVMDGTNIARVYADAAEADTAANTMVVWCPLYSQVYVRARGDGNTLYSDPTHAYSTFTGVLLAQQ